MSDLERAVDRIEHGKAWEETDEVVDVEVKRPLDKVVLVRLPSRQWEALDRQARELGVDPSTLVRAWVLGKLRAVPTSPSTATPTG